MTAYTLKMNTRSWFFGIVEDSLQAAGRVETDTPAIPSKRMVGVFCVRPYSLSLAIDDLGFLHLGRGNRTGCKNYGHYRAQGDNGGQGLEPCRAGK